MNIITQKYMNPEQRRRCKLAEFFCTHKASTTGVVEGFLGVSMRLRSCTALQKGAHMTSVCRV